MKNQRRLGVIVTALLFSILATACDGDLSENTPAFEKSELTTSSYRTRRHRQSVSTNTPSPSSGSTLTTPVSSNGTYFVDCQGGSDSNNGGSEATAFQSLTKASEIKFGPGTSLYLKRGCSWTNQSLIINGSGTSSASITIGTYGTDEAKPMIYPGGSASKTGEVGVRIAGSYISVDGISVVQRNDDLGTVNIGSCTQKIGWRVGFFLTAGASNVSVKNCEASNGTVGFHIDAGANGNYFENNKAYYNYVMSVADPGGNGNDSGAWAFLIHSNDNVFYNNTTYANYACSYDFGADGADYEIYEGSRNKIQNAWGHDLALVEVALGDSNVVENSTFLQIPNVADQFVNINPSATNTIIRNNNFQKVDYTPWGIY